MKKAQKTLDYFLILESKRRQFFFVDWTKASASAAWLHELEEKKAVDFKATVKWKAIGDIVLCCIDEANKSLYQSPVQAHKDDCQKMISFLKSHLQKAIRRQKLSQALSTSLQILALSVDEFLRRLCIIVFEDVRLQSFFPNLMWLTSAVSKGYQLSSNHIGMLLSYVTLLVNDNTALWLPLSQKEEKPHIGRYVDQIEKSKVMSNKQKNLLYCILFRRSYGGMECDMKMLLSHFIHYLQTFSEGKSLEEKALPEVNPADIPLLLKESEFVIEAIDFNCFPFIIQKIKEDIGDESKYSSEDLKSCIWEYNSKINTRCTNLVDDPKLEPIWTEIRNSLRKIQLSILSSTIVPQTHKLLLND